MLLVGIAVSAFVLLVFCACAGVVFLTQVVSWYEYANANPELVARRFASGRLWAVSKVALLETLALFHLVFLWPFGLFHQGFPRRLQPDDTPVILVHGLFQNRTCWWWLARALRRRGNKVLRYSISPWHNIEAVTEILDQHIDRLRHRYGIRQVVLVGHSMGGIIARNYVQLRGGAPKVAAIIQLATPNQGSKLAPFAISPLGVLLVPDSPFLQRLNAAPLPDCCPVTTIFSRRDNMVLPYSGCHLPGARNIELDGLGHTSLLFSPRVLNLVHQLLSHAGDVRCTASTLSPADAAN